MKKKRSIFVYIAIAAALVLTIVGCIVLPDYIIIQITASGDHINTVSKITGLLLPLGITAVFSISSITSKAIGSLSRLIVGVCGALIGIGMYIFIFTANL